MATTREILSQSASQMSEKIDELKREMRDEDMKSSEHNRRATQLRNEIQKLEDSLAAIKKTGEVE